MESLEHICQLFEQRLGINIQYPSSSVWSQAVHRRMEERNCPDEKQYYALLVTDHFEFQQLTELIIVPETWFYRDKAAFYYLSEWAKNFLKNKPNHTLRILSAPCSSGEEPYSIAMSLNEVEISYASYIIEAIDISKILIKKATKAIYGKRTLRNTDDHLLKKYFYKSAAGEFALIPTLHQHIYFKQANLLDTGLFSSRVKYDVIFCRNLLIYLQPNIQKKLIHILTKILGPEGLLFVAPSEIEAVRSQGFYSVGNPRACALIFGEKSPTPQIREDLNDRLHELLRPASLHELSQTIKLEYPEGLKEAMELADRGRFDEAHKRCIEYLKTHKEDASAYFLLGAICHACGESRQAEEYFQKTIYLAPHHHEALVYLASLLEKRGDHEKAKIYRDRIQRSLEQHQLNESWIQKHQ